MKVLINKCYGGFGISASALIELIKRNSNCLKKYKPLEYYQGDNERWEKDFKDYVDIGDGYFTHKYEYNVYKDGFLYSINDNEKGIRIDSDLIEIVEKLKEKSFGRFANLKIVEIPDNIEFVIEEYDGIEHISEKHRTWS